MKGSSPRYQLGRLLTRFEAEKEGVYSGLFKLPLLGQKLPLPKSESPLDPAVSARMGGTGLPDLPREIISSLQLEFSVQRFGVSR